LNPEIISPWISLALSIVALGVTAKNWLNTDAKRNGETIARMRNEHAALMTRVQSVESELRHLPDRETTHRLELALEKVNGRLSSMDARLEPVAAISERLQELLLQQVKK